MLDEQTRTTILRLYEAGHGKRAIARALKLSRGAVKKVIDSGTSQVPALARTEKAEPYHEQIIALFSSCKGNLVRVHEELQAQGAELSYSGLTAYCRRHSIGRKLPEPAGRYVFEPGQETQHDTSPHVAHIGGRERRVQIAGLVLCYSRMSFIQLYPRFTRFEWKVFLDDGLDYFGGACGICMIDNTGVVVLHGTGPDMVPVPEMAAFGEQRGFQFRAHEKGDANRSARVEGLFNYAQNNFLAGRQFRDWDEANHEAVVWCDKVNAAFSRKLHTSRRELFAKEQPHLLPLPIWRPPVYRLHHRIIDLEGYANVHGFRYSVPAKLIGRRVEVRETKSQLLIFDGPRLVATHTRRHDGTRRVCLPEHRREQRKRTHSKQFVAEEQSLCTALPGMESFIVELRKRARRGRALSDLRRLRRMVQDYPQEPLREALRVAAHYGLYDLDRIEKIVLQNIRGIFFPRIATDSSNEEETNE